MKEWITGTLPDQLLQSAKHEGMRVTGLHPTSGVTLGADRSFQARVNRFTEGCIGEAAFCHAYGLPYVTGATFEGRHEPDQHGCEVRATRPNRNLLVRPEDTDGRPMCLVWLSGSEYTVIGWAWVHEGKNKRWAQTNLSGRSHPCFLMPHQLLRSPPSLAEEMGWIEQQSTLGI